MWVAGALKFSFEKKPSRRPKNAEMRHSNLPAMAHLVALVVAGIVLASCSSGGVVGDYLPQWAGGTPKNIPPRPGTPEYDAFKQKQEAEAARDKSKDSPTRPKADPGAVGLPR